MHPQDKGRRRVLATSLTVTFSILCWFKYFNFFADAAQAAFSKIGWEFSPVMIQILLPVGISFYTFQSASYVVDVYRGKQKPCRNLIDYALFVSFFPQLVAGPIERAGHLLNQVSSQRKASPAQCADGLALIAWGMFKKLVIADGAALMANRAFSIQDASFPMVWGGVIAFGVQIYADFSAYTDIARGSARLLGFDLMENFRHPYISRSPVEFWRRWHISLSTWFRDYVYIPLGGSRCGKWRVAFNLFVTFALSGLWHGSNWNFVIWGSYHGLLVAGQHLWMSARGERDGGSSWWLSAIEWGATFILVHVGWLVFREQNTDYLMKYFEMSPFGVPVEDWEMGFYFAVHAQVLAIPLWLHALFDAKRGKLAACLQGVSVQRRARWQVVAYGLFIFLMVWGIFALRAPATSEFIYFQF